MKSGVQIPPPLPDLIIVFKNIKKFHGKPIINYSIEALIKTKLFDKIHVSTDSIQFTKLIKKNFSLDTDFLRPKSLSNHKTPIFEVLKYVHKEYKRRGVYSDEIFMLTPISPLIDSSDIKKAFNNFHSQKIKSPIISVSEFAVPFEFSYTINKKKMLVPVHKRDITRDSKSLITRYFDTGNFAIFEPDHLFKNKLLDIYLKFKPYILPKNKSIDIDDMEDWSIALKLFSKK